MLLSGKIGKSVRWQKRLDPVQVFCNWTGWVDTCQSTEQPTHDPHILPESILTNRQEIFKRVKVLRSDLNKGNGILPRLSLFLSPSSVTKNFGSKPYVWQWRVHTITCLVHFCGSRFSYVGPSPFLVLIKTVNNSIIIIRNKIFFDYISPQFVERVPAPDYFVTVIINLWQSDQSKTRQLKMYHDSWRCTTTESRLPCYLLLSVFRCYPKLHWDDSINFLVYFLPFA